MRGCDKPLRLTDILLYPWDGGLDVCVDLTGSSSLTQSGMVDFVPGRVLINVAQCKRRDIGACAAAYIFNRISFAIAKGSLSELQCTSDGPMGRPAVHCSSEVGVKFRHNLVRDILVDICSKFGIMVRKEAPIGFFSKDGKDLRPADLLLFNWLQGKDLCLDVTGISPFAGMGASSWAHRVALNNVVEKKKRKYASISVGTVWRRLVSKAGGSEAILHSVNRLIELVGMMLVFRSFFHAWYLDDYTIVGYTFVVGKVLELIMKDGPGCGLHLNVDKTEVFWPKEDPRSRLAGIFPPNIARPLHGVKLLGGLASVDIDFCNELVMKRVAKTIGLIDAIAKINDPQCQLLLLYSCTGISRLYFTMRTCPLRVFESAQRSFDVALRSSLKRIVTASGPGFDYWQWRLATLPFAFGALVSILRVMF
nr:hypothetical protein [Tanacetum cinerariifolium]